MDKRKTQVNNIRYKSGLLCSPEHSKVCFLLHETPFAAQNSLLCRGLWPTSEVGLPAVNFSSEEDMRFLKMFDRSGMTSKSAFIKARIFDEPFHVVTFDKSQHEYYAKLSDFHAQFRMVGNNYNQTLKELKSHFSERRTMALVCKLEKYMMQLVQTMHKVTELTIEYRKKYAGK